MPLRPNMRLWKVAGSLCAASALMTGGGFVDAFGLVSHGAMGGAMPAVVLSVISGDVNVEAAANSEGGRGREFMRSAKS